MVWEAQLDRGRVTVKAAHGEHRVLAVFKLMDAASPRARSVLSALGCCRKEWRIYPATGYPALAIVPMASTRLLESVVSDFEAQLERVGISGTPASVRDTPQERAL